MSEVIEEWASAVWAGIVMVFTVALLLAFYILGSTAWSSMFG